MQQKDLHVDSSGLLKRFFINYPVDSNATGQLTQAQIPSTWGDISFVPVEDYLRNTEKFCPEDTRRTYSVNYDKVLCASVRPPSVEEKSSAKVTVRGSLGDLITGNGLLNENLKINVLDQSGFQIIEPLNKTTGTNGTFISSLSDLNLESGRYRILVTPISSEYSNLSSIAYLDVFNDVLTTDEFVSLSGTYIGLIAAAIGVVAFLPRIKSYYSLRRQRKNLVTQLAEINSIYDSTQVLNPPQPYNKEDIMKRLRDKRDHILRLFETGELNQDHFSILSNKISEYSDGLDQK